MRAFVETVILKIGGSVITNKDSNRFEIRRDEIHRIASEIGNARTARPMRLVLVHGAGPFGHTMVTNYGIAGGVNVPKGTEGFVRTHNSMQDLNYVLMCILRDEGLLGFPIQPSACIRQKGREVASFETSIVGGLLDLDDEIIPILYGDMVLDESIGASVVSGDAIVAHLAPALRADRVLMGTDVDGVFEGDPKTDPASAPISTITEENFDRVMESVRGATTVDVTGGMHKKLLEIHDRLSGIGVAIFDALAPGNVEKALLGQKVGTEISFDR